MRSWPKAIILHNYYSTYSTQRSKRNSRKYCNSFTSITSTSIYEFFSESCWSDGWAVTALRFLLFWLFVRRCFVVSLLTFQIGLDKHFSILPHLNSLRKVDCQRCCWLEDVGSPLLHLDRPSAAGSVTGWLHCQHGLLGFDRSSFLASEIKHEEWWVVWICFQKHQFQPIERVSTSIALLVSTFNAALSASSSMKSMSRLVTIPRNLRAGIAEHETFPTQLGQWYSNSNHPGMKQLGWGVSVRWSKTIKNCSESMTAKLVDNRKVLYDMQKNMTFLVRFLLRNVQHNLTTYWINCISGGG